MGNQQSFVIGANAMAERVASGGIISNMIVYLKTKYHFSNAAAANIMFLWNASFNLLQLVGGILSDSWLGRFQVILGGSIFLIGGMCTLWSTAFFPSLTPRCNLSSCESPHAGQLSVLFIALVLIASGIGGIRPCSFGFGLDQLDDPTNPNNKDILMRYRNTYFSCVGLSNILAFTAIVLLQTSVSWVVGFGLPGLVMMVFTGVFWLRSVHYVIHDQQNIMARCAQVAVATWKSRNLQDPPNVEYLREAGSSLEVPSDRLRCFNRACMRRDAANDLTVGGAIREPWKLCTVKQVEEFKVLIRVLPIFACGVMFSVGVGQNNFGVLQALTMDRHVGKLIIPAGTFYAFEMLAAVVIQKMYDPYLAPLIAMVIPGGLNHRTKIGLGFFFSCAATIVAAIVESSRREQAIEHTRHVNEDISVVHMTAMKLVPQFLLTGMAGYFGSICQITFYQSQFPASMRSIASSLWAFGVGLGNLMGSAILSGVHTNTGWIGDNLSESHLDYYYWLINGVSFLSFLCYLPVAWLYGTEVPIAWEDAGEGG